MPEPTENEETAGTSSSTGRPIVKENKRPRRATARMSGSGWPCRYVQQTDETSSDDESDGNDDNGEITIIYILLIVLFSFS
jgi:hypothetical protein